MADHELTPLMKQYNELKAQAGDALMFFRMGDFYELFGDDAVTAARVLEITLTSRDRNKTNPTPMAGVPHHSAQGYIQRLLKAGYKVSICEQLEDPANSGAKLVKRGITRTFTPAIQFEAEGSEAAYLATALKNEKDLWFLTCLDSSTGETRVSEPMSLTALAAEVTAWPIRHFLRIGHALPEEVTTSLVGGAIAAAHSQPHTGVLIEDIPSNYLNLDQAEATLKDHFGVGDLSAFITHTEAVHALGICVTYLLRTQQQERLPHLRIPMPLHKPKSLSYGPRTPQHLDLDDLFTFINRTRSSMGARHLRRWLNEPMKDAAEITRRQTTVRELSLRSSLCEKSSELMAGAYDLERISGRITTRLANPRDTLALGRTLALLPAAAQLVTQLESPAAQELAENLKKSSAQLGTLAQRILISQREDAPLVARDGGIFSAGVSEELDRLISLAENGQKWLIELETREREATGIPSLKVRYNRVFGYYIEITSAHLKNAPAHYQRKQTTVGAERFFTDELKKFEDEIIHASSKQKAMEQQMFDELLAAALAEIPAIMQAARELAEIDALTSLSRLAQNPGWCFPLINDSLELSIEGGRHPLVDAASNGRFVPNDTRLSPSTRLTLLITGPNMGGKSTVMRQVALIVILGQMAAPIPAARAQWGAVSALHTRIGAHDAIARGQSTFMVEMSELAHILHHADSHSLIILDEIGRGTSTYDGMSVAWATLEFIARKIQARTLFATHYHELTRMASQLPHVENAHMAVATEKSGKKTAQGDSLRFLYQLKEGPTNESFGIHVAKLAGLPTPVIERAWQVLAELEAQSSPHAQASIPGQLSLFDFAAPASPSPEPEPELPPPPHPVLTTLAELNLNALTPLQAMNLLDELKTQCTSL